MDPPLPGVLLWHFLHVTFLLLQVGSAYSRFRFSTTSVLLHWGWSCELFLHYTRTISLTARQFKINSALRQFFFHGVWSTSLHFFSKLHGSTRATRQPQKTYVRGTPVPWTSPSKPEAKPKTSRTDYGQRLSRETSRFLIMFLPRPLTFKRKVHCFCSTTFVLSLHLISWIALALHRGWCRLWRWHF